MWSFERYQRWVDQRGSWTKPSQGVPLEVKSDADSISNSLPKFQRPIQKTFNKEAQPHRPLQKSTPFQKDKSTTNHGRIEINPIEDDLEELARQITKDDGSDDHG